MTPDQFVYDAVKNNCLSLGATIEAANNYAEAAKKKYNQNIFVKPITLIEESIKACKREINKI